MGSPRKVTPPRVSHVVLTPPCSRDIPARPRTRPVIHRNLEPLRARRGHGRRSRIGVYPRGRKVGDPGDDQEGVQDRRRVTGVVVSLIHRDLEPGSNSLCTLDEVES
jgi:hypothetical protein